MPISYPDVLKLKTEGVPYSWSDREVMLYALGIGMGSDPLDEKELLFVNEGYFTKKPLFFQWFQNQFERRWDSNTEYKAFIPAGPGAPKINAPALAATNVPTSVTLSWDGGAWDRANFPLPADRPWRLPIPLPSAGACPPTRHKPPPRNN